MSDSAIAIETPGIAQSYSPSRRRNVVIGGALIVLVVLAAYHNSFHGPFIFDDVVNIVQNPTIRHLGTALSPLPNSLAGGRPILNLSLAANYALGGTSVWGYHAVNLVIHILAALTLYGIVRRTLLRPSLRTRFNDSREWIALAVALIWAVHPLQTEAVTYISQRCESLMGLFYLLTLYAFIRGVESRRRIAWFGVSAVACFLGVASKEVMVTAPVMVLLYDRTFVSGSFREAWTRHRRFYLGLASSWLLLGYLMVGLRSRSVGYGLGISWWGYALTECRAIVHYLRLAVWPHPLILDYGEYAPIQHLEVVIPYVLILVVLTTVVFIELKRHPTIGFFGAWFFVILAPTSSIVPLTGSPVGEHRMYLPLASVVTLAVVGSVALGSRLLNKRQRVPFTCLAWGTVVALFTFLTIQRNRDYTSAMRIWQDTAEKCPNNPRAHGNFGTVLLQAGKPQEAVPQFEAALRIKPDYADAHYNLGLALVRLGKDPDAIQEFEQALQIKPDYADAHDDLALAFERMGKVDEAIAHYEQALRINPDFVDAHNNLAVALARQGRVQEAIEHWEQALRINPEDADVHYNFGIGLEQVGRVQEAIEQYEDALRIKPDYVEAQHNFDRLKASQQ